MNNGRVVSRNYAVAFLNAFIDEISIDDFLVLRDLFVFWQDNRKALYQLSMPGLAFEKKMDAIDELLKRLSAPASLKELFALLIRQKRELLIPEVLENICVLYMRRKNILFFEISSAHQLSDDEVASVQQFLVRKTGKTVLYSCSIDKDLIAGIRCQGETLVWEHSVRKQLDDLRRQLILQGSTT